MLVEVTVLVKIQEERENRVTTFRTPTEILINFPQTQLKYAWHYSV
jgi:hypothetical protein